LGKGKENCTAQEKQTADHVLYEQGVLSKMQFYEEEKNYISAQNQFQNLKKASIQLSISITDLEKQLNELEFSFQEQKKTSNKKIENQLAMIQNSLSNWEMEYQFIAPIDGRLSYLYNINENQFVSANSELLAIVPENQNYMGLVHIPSTGYGKIKKGQKVRLKMDKFPYQEYGQLNGSITNISIIPNKKTYLVKVKLSNGLVSSYNRTLTYTPNMTGKAEIITDDLRLIERVFNQFKKLVDK